MSLAACSNHGSKQQIINPQVLVQMRRKRTRLGGLALDGLHVHRSGAGLCARISSSVSSHDLSRFMLDSCDTSPGAQHDHGWRGRVKVQQIRRGPHGRHDAALINVDPSNIKSQSVLPASGRYNGATVGLCRAIDMSTAGHAALRSAANSRRLTLCLSSRDHDEEEVVVVGCSECRCWSLEVVCVVSDPLFDAATLLGSKTPNLITQIQHSDGESAGVVPCPVEDHDACCAEHVISQIRLTWRNRRRVIQLMMFVPGLGFLQGLHSGVQRIWLPRDRSITFT